MFGWRSLCVKGGHGKWYGFQGPGKQRVKGEWLEEGERIIRIIFQGLEEGQTEKRAGCSKSNKTQVLVYGHENKPAGCLSTVTVCLSIHPTTIHPSACFLGKCCHRTCEPLAFICIFFFLFIHHFPFSLSLVCMCVFVCVCGDINPDWLDVFWLRTKWNRS